MSPYTDTLLTKTLKRRHVANERVIKALSCLTRNEAMHVILGWMSIDKVNELADFQEQPNKIT